MGNMCLIVLVFLYKKTGFITALILLACQFPSISISFFVRRNPNSLPGLFMNLLTIITIIVIYFSNAKIERFQQRIQEQAVTDMLTGLPNQFASTELMMELSGHNEKFVLATFDLNNFKSINETMGHEAGNQVLKEIARRWKALADSEQTGTIDFIARLSGDEFLLIIRKYPLAEDALETIKLYKKELGDLPGFKVYKSVANFILIKYPLEIKESLMEALKIQDYKIKFMGDKGLESCLRITLGRKEQTKVVCDTIKAVYEKLKN